MISAFSKWNCVGMAHLAYIWSLQKLHLSMDFSLVQSRTFPHLKKLVFNNFLIFTFLTKQGGSQVPP